MPYPSKTDRHTILAVAMDQIARHGTDKLAIRSVASELGLAPNALYRYFDSLAALHAALADESRLRLLEALQHAAGKKRPKAAIESIAQAYMQFAREHPAAFSLTLLPGAPETQGDAQPAHLKSWLFTLGHVGQLYGDQRAPEATVALWAFLHGMTALEAAGVFGEVKPAASFEFGLRMWLASADQ